MVRKADKSLVSELEVSVSALALGAEHSVLVESCRKLAGVLDGAEVVDDKLWREWRLLLRLLLEAGGAESADDRSELQEWLQSMKGEG